MKIKEKFESLKEKNEAALICFYTAGFPDFSTSMRNIRVLAENGADIIEVGIPFSDPIADGVVIQKASVQALKNRISLMKIIEGVSKLNITVPVVFMSYLNPVLKFSLKEFFERAEESGIAGVIFPDLPAEESEEIRFFADERDIDTIFLVSPASSAERIKMNATISRGFIYCVSVSGVTGMRSSLSEQARPLIRRVSQVTDTPAALGFGISTPVHVREASGIADGVIVGSKIIDEVMNGGDLKLLVRELKDATIR